MPWEALMPQMSEHKQTPVRFGVPLLVEEMHMIRVTGEEFTQGSCHLVSWFHVLSGE